MARYLFSGLLILLLQVGCAHTSQHQQTFATTALPAEDAPAFGLAVEGKPVISTVSHRLEPALRILDLRKDIEKQYFPGETEPRHFRDAVSVLPMESFEPGFEKRISRAVLEGLLDPLKYDSIEVRLKSFHVTLDAREQTYEKLLYDFRHWNDHRDVIDQRREDQRKTRDENRRDEIRLRRQLGISDSRDDDNGFGSQVAGFLLDRALIRPIQRSDRKREQDRRFATTPQSIPVEFTQGKQEGWNCHVDLEVVLMSRNGTLQKLDITYDGTRPHDDEQSTTGQGQAIVLKALLSVSNDLRSQTN